MVQILKKRSLEEKNSNISIKDFPSYYKEFKFFCSIYKGRENQLSHAIIKNLPTRLEDDKKTYRILDVGSSDGALIENLIDKLSTQLKTKIEIIALEPDQETFSHLREKFEKVSCVKTGWSVDCLLTNLEDYLSKRKYLHKFDLILCSHVFYHLKPSQWNNIILTFQKRLEKKGKIVVILDSYGSPIYKFKKEIVPFFQENYASSFGNEISAEMFMNFIHEKNIEYHNKIIKSHIIIPINSKVENLIRLLTFLFRHNFNLKNKDMLKIMQFANKYINGKFYIFPWRENIFTIS